MRHQAPATSRDREGGFTLLDVLIALTVLATLAAFLPGSFVLARQTLDESQQWLDARLVAESVLNQAFSVDELRPGVRSGTLNGHAWRAVTHVDNRFGAPGDRDDALYATRLALEIGGGRSITIERLTMGRRQ